MAVSSIINNKMRSFLTMLGIIIGIMAVIVLVSVMNGLTGEVTDMFNDIGTTSITVSIMPRSIKTVKPDEVFEWIEDKPELFANASPSVNLNGTVKTAESGDDSLSTSCKGVSEGYIDMKPTIEMEKGRFLKFIDCDRELKSCVLGSYQANYFFDGADKAVGQTLKINGLPFEVVGVIKEIDDSSENSSDDAIYVPYTTAMKANGSTVVSSYMINAANENVVQQASASIKDFLNRKIGDSDYYNVITMMSMLDTMTDMMDKMGMVLIAIAAISLLVGGIGIMNIMLVSVTERTREIGIRKSLGAKQRHIMTQFVMEAATVSCIGGVIGIILGSTLAIFAGKLLGMATSPSIEAIAVAFGVSVAIGIGFGYLPAKKAARLNPIDALRYD